MTPDDNNGELEELKIDRQRRAMLDSGYLSQKIGGRDPRFTSLIGWAWTLIGSVAVLVGIGGYNKLSSINDTLIQAVSDLKNQSTQIIELKGEVRELRTEQAAMQRQVDSLEGKTLRGIEEMKHGQ